MFKILFPYKLQLQIFQQDEYGIGKFLSWIGSHFLTRSTENKKPLVLTPKARAILFLAMFLAALKIAGLTLLFGWLGFIFGILLATQAYLFLIVAQILLLPYEAYRKNAIKKITEEKLATFPKLKIIGITGSYGKTSVKEFVYQILKTKYSVLRTPNSYNTPYGIAKVVDLELDDSYEYFVCEMGAYKVGDIAEMCNMVHPRYGILTGINEQHLETFGSLENTTKGKFELIDSLPKNGFSVVNGDNVRVKKAMAQYTHITAYGFGNTRFSIKNIVVTSHGSEFTLLLDGKKFTAKTKLLGNSTLQNILAAATMCYLQGMKPQEIISAIASLHAVAHRLEIKDMGTMTLIDDAYNSNIDGFKEAITLLRTYDKPKVFVTPGIVDLGDKTFSVHEDLGKLFDGIDYVILIGNSDRVRGLKAGIAKKEKVIELASIKQVWKKIEELNLKHPVVLLENDLPDNY